MDLPKTLSAIKQLIGEGNIEQALEQLVALLDSDPKYAELEQTARVNQGEFYQVKAQMLKNTLAPEDARLATNQLADNVLQIVRRLEAGQLTFEAPETKPSRRQAWRYYVIGGIATLALGILAWLFFGKKDDCPTFSKKAQYRVMILPFKQTGDMKNFEPEFEISDGLNRLIVRTPGLEADVDVHEQYDIEENYPSFNEAAEMAENCGVQMIVWGKINKSSEQEYKIDVFYKLLGTDIALSTGDTTLSNLLKTKEEGQQLTRDAAAVTNFLYIVLANQAQVPIAANLMDDIAPPPTTTSTAANDTSWMFTMLALAEYYKNNGQDNEAVKAYDQVLESFPGNEEARQKRGALLYKKGDFAAAARDLSFATATSDLLKIRAEAALKSGNPAKAMEDLDSLRKTSGGTSSKWIQQKVQEIRDTTNAMQKRLDDIERKALSRPQDAKTQIQAAKTSAGLGDHDKALTYINKAIKTAPKNETAYELKVETQLAKGDTVAAEKTLQEAEKNGVNPRSIQKWRPAVRVLDAPLRRQE